MKGFLFLHNEPQAHLLFFVILFAHIHHIDTFIGPFKTAFVLRLCVSNHYVIMFDAYTFHAQIVVRAIDEAIVSRTKNSFAAIIASKNLAKQWMNERSGRFCYRITCGVAHTFIELLQVDNVRPAPIW